MSTTTSHFSIVTEPPAFCAYADGACDQSFTDAPRPDGLFLYPSDPIIIASTIEESVQHLKRAAGAKRWLTWKDLGVLGQIIFCRICKAIRFADVVIADVTNLNFNLLFEIGYSIGLGIPVIPVRDTSFVKDSRIFSELGLIDTLGYCDFENAWQLSSKILATGRPSPVWPQAHALDKERPLYVMKSPVHTEGMVRLMSSVKKSGLRFRSYDPRESARLSLHEAYKQASESLGVVVHLMSPERYGAIVHNGRCAFVSGLALAMGRRVLMLQETRVAQPIDYRDIVLCYDSPTAIPDLLIPFIKSVVELMQVSRFVPTSLPLTPLEKVDLGDVAAENEILALRSYFVPTGQYNDVKRGHARLVVGRKGAGKTAMFYGVREAYGSQKSILLLDLKPEGHQFMKLREAILQNLSPGVQQHVLTAFWNYLLLMEIAHKIIQTESKSAYRSPDLHKCYQDIQTTYNAHSDSETEQGDFSERLLALVDDIVRRSMSVADLAQGGEVTKLIYRTDIRNLNDAIGRYLTASRKDCVWLLFDNIDKGWPIFDIKREDIAVVSSLLEATRKLQRQFENRSVELRAVVFIRNDIYEHLILDPADRGKESPAIIDWSDPEPIKEMLRRRMAQSTELDEPFEELWRLFFASHVGGEESFSYILARTLMRPREVLQFVRGCVNCAVNRKHESVEEQDILFAEKSYSDDALVDVAMELKDVRPEFSNAPYAFIGSPAILTHSEVGIALMKTGHAIAENPEKVKNLLLWFGFLGISISPDEERYSYQFEHDLQKMTRGVENFSYCIHPAYRKALGVY